MTLLQSAQLEHRTREPETDERSADRELTRYIKFLPEDDQLMVELILRRNVTHREMARVMRCSAGSITRRMGRVLRLLSDPLVIALADPNCSLDPLHRQIAIERRLHGRTVAEIAKQQSISCQQVCRMLQYAEGWAAAFSLQVKAEERQKLLLALSGGSNDRRRGNRSAR